MTCMAWSRRSIAFPRPSQVPSRRQPARVCSAALSASTSTADGQTEIVRPSKYEEPDAERIPPGDAVPHKAKRSGESPFVEEDPSTIGKPAMHPGEENPEACGCDADQCEQWCQACRRWVDVDCSTSVDGFKGPIDFANANGNFGLKFGINGAVALLPRLGIGLQAGTSEVLSNLKGSPFPEPNATNRSQEFVTVGMFQRINRENGALTWGFAYDWLFDQYYSDFAFGQWRVKGAWEFNPCDEIGLTAAIPEHGDSGEIPDFFGGTDVLHFKPISQGYLYWRHTWENEASVTGRAGVAERPGEFVFGGESRVPVTKNLALTSDFTYIMPNASGGAVGQTEEIWNVSFGIEFVPGGFNRCCGRFQPFLPVADNGSMAVRELVQ